ncbi:MAG: 2-oxo-4-hydroxy-4-carboxy-5-ureidoimidazoline decarboxylase [Enterobacterales bacterium]|jgi:2-oxo-4-hydroxy-4-carboxy-5-ureidoimidazoline decarboxylase
MKIEELNKVTEAEAEKLFMQCCTSSSWISKMIKARPFTDQKILVTKANQNWQRLDESDYLEAFEGHPRIGDVNSLREKYASTKKLASGEQIAVQDASEEILTELATGNENYYIKFGFIFIVCATGKSALEMLELLTERLANDRTTELMKAAEEQRKIFQIRLDKCLETTL